MSVRFVNCPLFHDIMIVQVATFYSLKRFEIFKLNWIRYFVLEQSRHQISSDANRGQDYSDHKGSISIYNVAVNIVQCGIILCKFYFTLIDECITACQGIYPKRRIESYGASSISVQLNSILNTWNQRWSYWLHSILPLRNVEFESCFL